ncbi:trypsin-like peptidase domain-containing protein [Lachnospiraceae bacterium MD1]|uniref:RNA-directed DNA polymerase n=1 Tax=Variimorphobacter saccharofermentans TaxID=2755051 RepID=A0A839K2Z7_9FIRM|nr:reverse transcriptase domain-containing protein [Variimorphobacter saccharofermentans]MBB2184000.1 trypsin-like peptidase domain-containing protein [Variimorphobacter saccharofermentans]
MINARTDIETEKLFYQMQSREDVADILQIEDKSLRYFLYAIKPDNMYTEFKIPKKNGEYRKISAPNKKLRSIQRKLADILNIAYKVKPASYGFVKNKSIYQNADNHCKRKNVLNIDLKDFFTQIHFGRVRGLFMKPPYNLGEEAAMVIAQIACYRGVLPQGAPTSPIITNMICSPLDTQLTHLAKKNQVVYTRYADDITFSCYKNSFPEALVYLDKGDIHIGKELEFILKKNNFVVNMNKVRLMDNRRRQEVTGLVVNKFTNLKREYIKEVRAILHCCKNKGIYDSAKIYVNKGKCNNHRIKAYIQNEDKVDRKEDVSNWFEQVLKGKIGYIKLIKGNDNPTFLKYAKQLNIISNKKIFNIDEYDKFHNMIDDNIFILQCTSKNVARQGSGFLLKTYGLMTSYHVIPDDNFYSVKKNTGKQVGVITKSSNLYKESYEIDYACYINICNNFDKSQNGFELGDSSNLKAGDKVIIIGYPNYMDGDTPYIHTCYITNKTSYFGQELYTISGRIAKGASGGVVLDLLHEVVGIIKGGVTSLEEDDESNDPEFKHGFIPIHDVIEHMRN